MIDKESCAGDLPVPNLPQVDDGNTVGDAALGLLAIASFIITYRLFSFFLPPSLFHSTTAQTRRKKSHGQS